MSLSTTDLPKNEGGLPKTIQPGNCTAKINTIDLEKVNLKDKEGAMHVILHLETEKPAPDFVGFALDKDNPSKGNYDGQVAKVKASRWFYIDGHTKGGTPINRDREILKFLQQLCTELGIIDWFRAQDNKFDTIEQFVKAMNESKPYKGIYMNWCLAGREYLNSKNYKDYDKFLPKTTRDGKPFESQSVKPGESKLQMFSRKEHIEELKNAKVNSFSGGEQPNTASEEVKSDFSLDDDES